jgi:hypothetical protein
MSSVLVASLAMLDLQAEHEHRQSGEDGHITIEFTSGRGTTTKVATSMGTLMRWTLLL